MTKDVTTPSVLPQPWDTDPLYGKNFGAVPMDPSIPSAYKFDLGVCIMRSQGFHLGHEDNIDKGLLVAQRVLVIIGSAHRSRDTRNPFTFEERKEMIEAHYNNDPRVIVVAQRDHPYNDTMWQSYVQKSVKAVLKGVDNPRIALVAHRKADTTYYIDMFSKWEHVEVEQKIDICATQLREVMYSEALNVTEKVDRLSAYISPRPLKVVEKLLNNTGELNRLMREASFLRKHKASWAKSPYAPTFVTVDSVVVQSGHVLLIQRRSAPGEGLWAIPGGYLDQGERIRDAYIRELVEETKIKVSANTIRGSVVDQEVFDYPGRSLRGRIITHAFCIKLRDGKLPAIKAASDAKRAIWVPIDKFYEMQDQMFEDHFYIIDYFLSRLKDGK